MAAKKGKKKIKVQDLKPKKDAKGGFGRFLHGAQHGAQHGSQHGAQHGAQHSAGH